MAELAKMARVAGARGRRARRTRRCSCSTRPWAANGLAQGREFAKAGGVTGLVLTKLDGTAKGGIAVAVVRELGVPIRYVGRRASRSTTCCPSTPAAFAAASWASERACRRAAERPAPTRR